MTREEAKANLNMISVAFVEPVTKEQKKLIDDTFDVAIQSLTAISELSKSLKAVNRYEMDEKVLIGFNMAVAIFNKCFGESCALKNERTEQDVGMCQQNVGEMSEKQTDGDLISREIEKADFLMAKVKDFERTAIRVKHNTEIIDRLIDYIHGVIVNAEKDRFVIDEERKCALREKFKLPSAEKTTINSQKTTITDGDLISKQDLLNATVNKNSIWNKITNSEGYNLEKIIENLSTYSLKEDTAEWIKQKSGDELFPEEIVCSKCYHSNSHLDFDEHNNPIGKVFLESKFCPNCGAKMIESKESEEEE